MTVQSVNSSRAIADPEARVRPYRAALLAIVIAGSVFRAVQYAWRTSLWHDEALVTLNVMHRSYGQLLRPLDYAQAAPPLFLWAERALLRGFGFGEYPLRIVSLLCGIGSLALFAFLAWRVFHFSVAPWVVALFAFCDKLIWHSAEVKQYSGDVLSAVLLMVLAIGLRRPVWRAGRMLVLSGAAAVLLWFSFPAIFVFGGLSLMLLTRLRRPLDRALWLGGNALVAGSFVLLYWFTVRGHATYLDDYWREHFADWSRPAWFPIWLVKEIYALCDHPYRSFGWLVLPLAAAGAWGLWKSPRRELLWAFAGPMGFCLVAACVHKYPFTGDRITIFLVPGLFLLCGEGLELLRLELPMTERWWWAPALPLIGLGIGLAIYHVGAPQTRSGIRPVVQHVRAHRKPGDAIYLVGEGATPQSPSVGGLNLELLCYWPDAEQGGPVHRTLPDVGAISERRFWIVFAALPHHGTRLMDPLLKRAASVAPEVDRKIVPGGGAVCYERPITTLPAAQ